MDSSVSPKDEIWFLWVCHHISTDLYHPLPPTAEVKERVQLYRYSPSGLLWPCGQLYVIYHFQTSGNKMYHTKRAWLWFDGYFSPLCVHHTGVYSPKFLKCDVSVTGYSINNFRAKTGGQSVDDTGWPGKKWWKTDFASFLLLFLWLPLTIRTIIFTFNP